MAKQVHRDVLLFYTKGGRQKKFGYIKGVFFYVPVYTISSFRSIWILKSRLCVCQMRQDLHSSLTSLFFIILSRFCSFQCMYEVGSPQFHTGVLLEEPDPNNY